MNFKISYDNDNSWKANYQEEFEEKHRKYGR